MTRSARSIVVKLLPLVLAAGLTATACGASVGGSAALPGAGAGAGAATSSSDSDVDSELAALTGDAGSSPQQATAKLDMQIRVVNLWSVKAGQTGGAIDVWEGDPQYGGQKLATVAYGTVSQFFAPEVQTGAGVDATAAHVDYRVAFYPAGKTKSSDMLIDQGETSSAKQQLTMLLSSPEPGNAGGTVQVMADAIGPASDGSFTAPAVAPPANGKAALLVNALGTEYLPTGNSDKQSASFVLATAAGKCAPYLDNETGKLHTDPNIGENVGGTEAITYLVDPNSAVALVRTPDGTSNLSFDQMCAQKPAISGLDPKLAAGKSAYAFIYGNSLSTLKSLIVPIGG